MKKYKDKYIIKYSKDFDGKVYNKDDNYIACRAKGQIYRYDGDTLKFVSSKKIRIRNIDKETGNIAWDYTDLILDVYDTDGERIITFKEENLEKLEDLFKIRKRKQLTEEQRENLRIRGLALRNYKNNSNDIVEK